MNNGDKVQWSDFENRIHTGTIFRLNTINVGGRQYSLIKSSTGGSNYVATSSLVLWNSDSLLIDMPGGLFKKEELLEIIDQDKPSDEILMDLRDHLTN